MIKLALVLALAVLGLELATSGECYLTDSALPNTYDGTDLSREERYQAAKMSDDFKRLGAALYEKTDTTDPEVNFKLLKKMLGSVKLSFKPDRKKALQFFLSVESIIGTCDLNSYKILATLYESIDNIYDGAHKTRIESVLTHFRRKHAEQCRPQYRGFYDQLIGYLDELTLYRVKHAFWRLTTLDVAWNRYDIDNASLITLASLPLPESLGRKAMRKIAKEVKRQATKEGRINEGPESLLVEYLFTPCKTYHELLNPVLGPARFDAKVELEGKSWSYHGNDGFGYFGGDYEFTDAIAYNRLCGKLVDDQESLQSDLVLAWSAKSDEDFLSAILVRGG